MKKIIKLIFSLVLCISLFSFEIKAQDSSVYNTIKQNLITMLTGKDIQSNSEQMKKKIKYIHDEANKVYKLIKNDNEFDKPIIVNGNISDGNLNTTFLNILKIASAYKTDYKDSTSLYNKTEVIEKIKKLLLNIYNSHLSDKSKTYTGNWYNWEISLPNSISKILILLENELEPELTTKYIQFLDDSLRAGKKDNPKIGEIQLDSSYHTGANLIDISLNRILQGAIKKDNARIKNAVDSMSTAFVKIDPNYLVNGNTDGVYLDDSFIQHHTVAYSGSYGKVYIDKTAQSLSLLKNTEYKLSETSLKFIKTAFEKTFLPIIYEGYVLENMKGRAVSRTATGYSDGLVFLEALLVIADYTQDTDLYGYAKYLNNIIPTYNKPNFTNIGAFKLLDELNTKPGDAKYISNGFYDYNMMDRDVSIQKDYLFTVARSSNRISKYEYMSKENTQPWLQGDGMHYLYLKGQFHDLHYGASYFHTIDPLELSGTTKTSESREDIVKNLGTNHNFDSIPTKRNEYLFFPTASNTISGSIKNNEFYFSTMQLGDDAGYIASNSDEKQFLDPNFKTYKNVEGNKSWFMLEDEILVMNSNISHPDKSLTLTTTIDNRQFNSDDKLDISIVNKGNINELKNSISPSTSPIYSDKADSLSLITSGRGKIGYYFFNNPKISVTKELRSGTSETVRPIDSGKKPYSKQFFKVQVDQTNNPSLAYVILPNQDKKQVSEYAPKMKILRSDNVHHIQYKDYDVYSFFEVASENGIEVSQPTLIIKQQIKDQLTLKISDSTLSAKQLIVKLDDKFNYALIDPNNKVSIDKNVITINSENSNGVPFELTLKVKEKEVINATSIQNTAQTRKMLGLQDNNTLISVHGLFFEGTKLHVKPILNTKSHLSFDISLSLDNKEVQLNGKVLVTIPVDSSKVVDKIEHIKNGQVINQMDLIDYKPHSSFIKFETDHFSEYRITFKEINPTSKSNVDTSDILHYTPFVFFISALLLFRLRKA